MHFCRCKEYLNFSISDKRNTESVRMLDWSRHPGGSRPFAEFRERTRIHTYPRPF